MSGWGSALPKLEKKLITVTEGSLTPAAMPHRAPAPTSSLHRVLRREPEQLRSGNHAGHCVDAAVCLGLSGVSRQGQPGDIHLPPHHSIRSAGCSPRLLLASSMYCMFE
ncbi:hypothetical protein ILYODFUR_020365 [Ilyodon furcidens]|uniref:Uncharacterized protein n=1 Tax=Ilyodon furcidens TaxID=33524 RepID=A0ABV0UTM5_9TELE